MTLKQPCAWRPGDEKPDLERYPDPPRWRRILCWMLDHRWQHTHTHAWRCLDCGLYRLIRPGTEINQ